MIDPKEFIHLESAVLQWREIAALLLANGDTTKVTAVLRSGEKIHFEGFEAAEVWKYFNPDPGWISKSGG